MSECQCGGQCGCETDTKSPATVATTDLPTSSATNVQSAVDQVDCGNTQAERLRDITLDRS